MKINPLPKVDLGYFPTPVVKLTRLSSTLGGPEIFMKRDDCLLDRPFPGSAPEWSA